jgi:hypothetical protein
MLSVPVILVGVVLFLVGTKNISFPERSSTIGLVQTLGSLLFTTVGVISIA